MKNENRKKGISSFLKPLAFVLVFLIVLEVLSLTLFSGQKAGQTNGRLADAYSFLNDDDYTIDVVAMGNSDLYSGFVPTELWEAYGITSTVSGSPHQSVSECQMILNDILEKQNPKVLLIETDILYDGRELESTGSASKNKIRTFIENTFDPEDFENTVSTLFPMFTFHNALKYYGESSMAHGYSHGYYFNNEVFDLNLEFNMTYNEDFDDPLADDVTELREFVKYAKSKGMQVTMIEVPTVSAWSYARHNSVTQIAKNIGVDFIDFNVLYDEVGISPYTCFRDNGNHLNYDAACKVTDYVGSYLMETYELEDHREDEKYADRWYNDLYEFKSINDIYVEE